MKKLTMLLVVMFGMILSYANADPVLRLKLNGNLNNTGTASITGITKGTNAAFSTATVPPNGSVQSLAFNTASDTDQSAKVVVPNNSALTFGSGFTMTFWLKADRNGWANCGMTIYDKLDTSTNKGILISTSALDSSAKLYVKINGHDAFTTSSGVNYVGSWYFIALTYNASTNTVTTYQGSSSSYTGAIGSTVISSAGAPESNNLDATIGYRTSYGGRALDGNLSDFRIYDGVLSSTAIEAIYNEDIPTPLAFGTKNEALLDVPVEPQEVYAISNRSSFSAPSTMTFVVSDAASANGPEYTAPGQLHNLFLERNASFTSQTVKASEWTGQLPAIIITSSSNLPSSISVNDDWLEACAQLGAMDTNESCRVLIESDLIVIAGHDLRGAFYGAQTLLAMFNNSETSTIAAKAIRDWPDLSLRAVLSETQTDPESLYAQLAYHHYNALIRDGSMWLNLNTNTTYQNYVQTWETLCNKYYLDPIPHIQLMGHANSILYSEPMTAEGFTAIEQPKLSDTEWYTLKCRNIIDQSNCPIVVQSLDGNTTYQRDVDYEIDEGVLAYHYLATNDPWSIRRISTGAIPSGAQVSIAYCYVAPESISYCPSEPQSLVLASQAIQNVFSYVNPKYLFIGHDEIQVVGKCPRCRARGLSNAELVADEISQLQNIVLQQSSSCKVMLWADTMDLQQNADGLNTLHMIDLLPEELIVCHWWYNAGELDWMEANMTHSTSRNFLSVGTVWKDNQNAVEWATVLKENNNWNNLSLGIILAPWGNDWTAMETTAQWAWSSRLPMPELPNQKERSITQVSGEPPTGLSFNFPFYQTFDSLDNWALPVPWISNYSPNATTNTRYYGTSGKSFEVSGPRLDVGRGTRMFLDNTTGYGYLYLSQRVWVESQNSGWGSRGLELYGPDTTTRAFIRVIKDNSNFLLQRGSPSGTVTVGSFPVDQWVLIDILCNVDKGTWSVFVNDQPAFENAQFTSLGDIAYISWYSSSVDDAYNGFWIDDVKVEHYNSPQVFLKLDNSTADSGTAEISGISMGASVSYAATSAAYYLNQSALFSPSSDNDSTASLTIPNNVALNLGSFTICGWLRPNSHGKAGCGMCLYDKYYTAGSDGISITYAWDATNHLKFYFCINDKYVYTNSSNEVVAVGASAPWVFTALTYDATTRTATAYFGYDDTEVYATDGVVFTGSGALHPDTNTLDAKIGFRQSTASRAIDGNLDDVHIYQRALTLDELEFIRSGNGR